MNCSTSQDERVFYQIFGQASGLYEIESADLLRTKISSRILEASRQANVFDLQKKRSATIINNVTSHLRGTVERRGAFAGKRPFIHLGNGVIVFTGSDCELHPFAPVLVLCVTSVRQFFSTRAHVVIDF